MEIIIWEHAVQIKEKSCPVATVKVLKCYLAAAGLVVTVQEWCQWKCWRQPGLEFVVTHRTRVGVTTQALAHLLCLDAVIWISELFQKSCYTVFCLPAVPGCCNLNFRPVSHDFLVQNSAESLCWEQRRAASFPTSHILVKYSISLTANGWSSSCGAFLHGWLLFYGNNWQHAPCLNPTGTCQVTFSLRFNILSELTKCSVLGVIGAGGRSCCCVALTK